MKAALIAQNVAAGVTAVAGVAASVVNAQTGAVRAPKVSAANVVSVIHAARANVANVQNAVRVQSVQLKKVPSARIAGRDKTVVRARNVASAQSRENRARHVNHASRVSRVSPANRVKIAVSARSSNNARKAMPISSKMFRIVESAQVVKVNDAVAAGAATGVNAESVLSAAMRASRSKTHSLTLPRKPIPANAHL